jgi:hypothetical protein
MKRRYSLGRLSGLQLSAGPSALVGSAAVAALAGLAFWRIGRSPAQAATAGLLAVPLHWSSVLFHHLGHAFAARQTGYAMRGVHFWGLLGKSLYPRDEPPLPAETHIRRALGGPVASSLLAVAAAALRLAQPQPGTGRDLATFALLDNLILGPGALFPLPMIDGGTLRTWWPRRGLPAGDDA